MSSKKETTRFINADELEPGDIVVFERAEGLYFHCGIYGGHHNVYHRAAASGSGSRAAIDSYSTLAKFGIESDKAEIRIDDLRVVAGSSPVFRYNMFDSDIRPNSGKEILKWAMERLGEKGYNLFYKNCQHFCTEARYGTSLNMQIEAMIDRSFKSTRVLVNIVSLPDMSLHPFSIPGPKTKILQPGYYQHTDTVPDKAPSPFLINMLRKRDRLLLVFNISTNCLATLTKLYHHSFPSNKKSEWHLMKCRLFKDLSHTSKYSSETSDKDTHLCDTSARAKHLVCISDKAMLLPYEPNPFCFLTYFLETFNSLSDTPDTANNVFCIRNTSINVPESVSCRAAYDLMSTGIHLSDLLGTEIHVPLSDLMGTEVHVPFSDFLGTEVPLSDFLGTEIPDTSDVYNSMGGFTQQMLESNYNANNNEMVYSNFTSVCTDYNFCHMGATSSTSVMALQNFAIGNSTCTSTGCVLV